jgi:hypothetical protein
LFSSIIISSSSNSSIPRCCSGVEVSMLAPSGIAVQQLQQQQQHSQMLQRFVSEYARPLQQKQWQQ